jgi:hypothetical protein
VVLKTAPLQQRYTRQPAKSSWTRFECDSAAAILAQPIQPRSFQLHFNPGKSRINKARVALNPQIVDAVKYCSALAIPVIGHNVTSASLP